MNEKEIAKRLNGDGEPGIERCVMILIKHLLEEMISKGNAEENPEIDSQHVFDLLHDHWRDQIIWSGDRRREFEAAMELSKRYRMVQTKTLRFLLGKS